MKARERDELLQTLQDRFERHASRHADVRWDDVYAKLRGHSKALKSLLAMESTGGEPDVIGRGDEAGTFLFCDCSAESPQGRRSLCYDRAALDARKLNKPAGNAVEMAADMGVELLTEQLYRHLQALGQFDLKTSSWILTTPDVRALGGALFCDRRYGHVFTYHNGADAYFAARGFRAALIV